MKHTFFDGQQMPIADDEDSSLPNPPDCETNALLRRFLAPVLETAPSWPDLIAQLAAKGYAVAFRAGHLVILNEQHKPICTGAMLGVPLRDISARIGRPCIRASVDGHAGALHDKGR